MSALRKQLVGIDLGTTYSSVSVLDERDKPRALPNAVGQLITPSIVYFPEDGSRPLVGEPAILPSFQHPERFVEHAKRYLGSREKDWDIDGVLYTPVDISAIIVRHLLEDVSRQIGRVSDAVITVPAHFSGYQRQLVIEAGQQAGLETVNIVNEPVAAALSFVLDGRVIGDEAEALSLLDADESTILVFDLGGGTLDLSIVRHDHRQLRVLAASGDERLGGIDWDDELLNVVIQPLRMICGNIRQNPLALRRVRFELEAAKRRLSASATTTLRVDFGPEPLEFAVTRAEFERQTQHLVERTRALTEDLLSTCNLTWDDILHLVPVGGATMMPMIQAIFATFEEQRKAQTGGYQYQFIRRIPPDLSIANGAALFAAIIQSDQPLLGTGATSSTLANYRTTNVATNGLGIVVIDVQGERVVHPLIQRQTPLPASATVTVSTTHPQQRRVSIKIVEGQGIAAVSNKVLCKCTLENLPPDLPSHSLFDVDLTLDADGFLHVVARHRDSGRLATVTSLYDLN